MTERFWEIDTLRGLAVVAMIIYHFFFDLHFFDIIDINMDTIAWMSFPRLIAGTFIFLVGVSLTISYHRAKKEFSEKFLWKKYLRRGAKIFVYGMAISAATFIFVPEGKIVFGVLHFIGLSIVLGYLFLRVDMKDIYLLISTAVFFAAGFLLENMRFPFEWLVWLGFRPEGFHSLDYFPLFPWFAIILLGLYTGKKLYSGEERKFDIRKVSNPGVDLFSFLGRYSLEVYFLHQPVLIALIYLMT